MRPILLSLAVGLALAASPASPAAAALTGTFTTTIRGSALPRFDGVWTIRLAPAGRYTILLGRTALISGTAVLSGSRITFQRESGPAACLGLASKGVYAWQLAGGTLRFTRVSDSCLGRRLVLAHAFVRAQ